MREDIINIPSVSVEELVNHLRALYRCAIKSGTPFQKIPTAFLWGPPGIGKSRAIYELAEAMRKECGVTVKVTDVRLLLFSPIDLRGVPVADAERKFTDWLMPRIFAMDEGEGCVNILFLDELSAAPQSVQAAAYQICLDRRIGEHVLPSNCIVLAAGNRMTDQSVSYKMPKALCNRLMHFNVKADYASWRKWAVEHGISDRVIAYLGFDPSRLCAEPTSSDLAYPTPRSWEFVSTLLTLSEEDPHALHGLVAACIGNDAALEFEAFCNGVLSMPSVQKILAGTCRDYPKSHDVMFALVSALVATVRGLGESITQTQLENLCDYVMKFPKDFVMTFMKDILVLPGMNERLMKCYGFQNWLSQNAKLL